MKKIMLLIMLAALLTGCGAHNRAQSGGLRVYTSFYALYDIVKHVGGDAIELTNIVPTGTEPHDWEPGIGDMAALENADILFYNGLGMEGWIDKVRASVENADLQFCELSSGIANDEADDPHVWLSPINADKMAYKAMELLSAADPENAALYKSNYTVFSQRLKQLDSDYRSRLADVKSKKIVVSHMAYSYLCSEYGIEQQAISGISADSEPSPDKMKELVKYIKDNNVKYIFYEELLSTKTAQTLSDETGARLLPLNPFEGLTDEEIAAGEDYVSVMEKNLENLCIALGE